MLRLLSCLTATILLASAARAENVPTGNELPLSAPLDHDTPQDETEARAKKAAAAVKARIERFKLYPLDATGEGGTVVVKFRLDGHGRLLESSIVTPNCSENLNKGALAILRWAAPFPPSDYYADGYTLPIVFEPRSEGHPIPPGCLPPPEKAKHPKRVRGLRPPE